jgi:hypothetical protein
MKDVTMSYNTVFIPGTSLTKQAIPVYDKIAINYLKHQNAIAKAPPSGIAININAIKSVSFGSNQTLEAPEIIKVYTQSGFLIYSQSAHAGMGNISQGSPIQQLPGGIGAQLDEFFRNFEMALAELREIFGVTPQASAAGKPINEGLGLAKMQMGVTDNSLSVMYDQARALKEKTATGIYRRFNVFVKNNPEWFNNAYPMLGQANTITIKLSSDMFDRNCHVKVVCLPNDEQKSIAIDAARESLKAGRNGGVGIKYADFVFVLRLIERGRVKEANAYISYKEEYYEKVAAKNQTALEEAKAKMVAEENARKEEAAKKMLELESSIEIDKTQKIEDIKFGFEKKRWEEIEKPRIQLESQLENAKVQKKP